MKKIISILVTVSMMALLLSGCGSSTESQTDGGSELSQENDVKETAEESKSSPDTSADSSDIKAGFIFIGDENDGYTYAFYEGVKEMQQVYGLTDAQISIKWNVGENESCFEAACDLADEGCDIIFANSFGHEDYLMQAAEIYPDVEFCHATGNQAADSGLDNMHNYYVAVEESRYVSGVVAGYKLNEMIRDGSISEEEAVIGYVGAYAYAQVISGYDAFYLGVKSVCPSATMKVKYTGSWGDQATEYDVAKALVEEENCVLISQHSNTTGPASACEELSTYVVGYNISMVDTAPHAALTSASLKWGPYMTYAVGCVLNGESIDADWCKGYPDDACYITEINENAFSPETYAEVIAKVSEVEKALKEDTLEVFAVDTFTVNGVELDDKYTDSKGNYPVWDGAYHESYFFSAPDVSFVIDGITELNQVF